MPGFPWRHPVIIRAISKLAMHQSSRSDLDALFPTAPSPWLSLNVLCRSRQDSSGSSFQLCSQGESAVSTGQRLPSQGALPSSGSEPLHEDASLLAAAWPGFGAGWMPSLPSIFEWFPGRGSQPLA